jgi:hypothetical protein
MAKIRFQAESFVFLILMLLSGALILVSVRYGFGTFRRPGPGLFPFFIGLLTFPLSLILLLLTFKPKKKAPLLSGDEVKTFLLMIGAFVLWIIALPLLGYPIVTLFVTFCLSKIMKLEGWIKPTILSVGTALFIYVLFDYWLYIDLPRGILG